MANGPNITQIAAWLGATTGSLALAWDAYKWLHRGARIVVDVSADMVEHQTYGTGEPQEKFVLVTVSNVGVQPTTITNVAGFWYRTPLQKLLHKPEVKFIVPLAAMGEQRIPYLLKPGERWMGRVTQSQGVEKYLQGWRFECGVFFTGSKRGCFRRVVRRPTPSKA